jgi:hypothetical protein
VITERRCRDDLEGLGRSPGDDLHDLGDGAFLVARVDALGE